ncbi:MAG: exonuclease subunit SbcD [Azospirillum sp.]|nr:exonuclease subunit SbcD [Azospirillum sp.]
MRLLHTADWHLGQNFHGWSRDREHRRFLDWLLDRLDGEDADALIIAGDVFDGQNPPIPAQRLFFNFLARAKARRPGLDVVVIAGNHDSGGRLEAPSPLLDEMAVRVVGGVAWDRARGLDAERLLIPLHDAAGRVAAWCIAMPYLRPADLPPAADADGELVSEPDPLIEGVRRLYAAAVAAAAVRREAGQALIATGHCYMTGGQISDLSERRILGGNLHALPAEIFPDELSYVALGHLHRAQRVAGRENLRYSGSPIPLAVDEVRYPHQVVSVEFDRDLAVAITPIPVPRFVDILRLPDGGTPGAAAAALAAIDRLPAAAAGSDPLDWPYLELSIRLDQPMPSLRGDCDAALVGKAVRLVGLAVSGGGSGQALADAVSQPDLAQLTPEEVFRRRWSRSHDGEPESAVIEAFLDVVQAVEEEAP